MFFLFPISQIPVNSIANLSKFLMLMYKEAYLNQGIFMSLISKNELEGISGVECEGEPFWSRSWFVAPSVSNLGMRNQNSWAFLKSQVILYFS